MDKITIENTLLELGMPIRLKGFKYISDAILLLDKPEWKNPKWTALYHCVATLNNESDSSIERSIRNAFASARRIGDIDIVSYYIGFDNCSNSNSLFLLYNRLKEKSNPISIEEIIDKLRTLMT